MATTLDRAALRAPKMKKRKPTTLPSLFLGSEMLDGQMGSLICRLFWALGPMPGILRVLEFTLTVRSTC